LDQFRPFVCPEIDLGSADFLLSVGLFKLKPKLFEDFER